MNECIFTSEYNKQKESEKNLQNKERCNQKNNKNYIYLTCSKKEKKRGGSKRTF